MDGPQLYFTSSSNEFQVHVVGGSNAALSLVSDQGVEVSAPVTGEDWFQTFTLDEARRYVRAELAHGNEMLALSNPRYPD